MLALKNKNLLMLWIVSICLLVGATLVVGGATRLTDSGLSITEWEPIVGAIPPMSPEEWERRFDMYKETPQFKLQFPGMQMSEFKFIFFWEYLHRNLGRLIGIVFIIPFLFFWLTGSFTSTLRNRLLIGFALGGLQGALGWYMVASGLIERVSVSHYRLAAHLGLAFFIFYYFFDLLLRLRNEGKQSKVERNDRDLYRLSSVLLLIIAVQIVWGAFVAGLRAGYMYNTFPTMNGEWIPSTLFYMKPWWMNFIENPSAVQFIHRWLAKVILVIAVFFVWLTWKRLGWKKELFKLKLFFICSLFVQVVLGVWTLLSGMSMSIALLHQFGALLVIVSLQMLRSGLNPTRS